MRTTNNGQMIIKHYESLHDGDLSEIGLQPKECPAGIWTVGWGHALFDSNGNPLKGESGYAKIATLFPQFLNMTITQADELLLKDLVKYENLVNNKLSRVVMQYQFDALVSFVYNCGVSETLFGLINTKASMDDICNWWETHYITASGVVKQGLIYRRKSESFLFSSATVKFFN